MGMIVFAKTPGGKIIKADARPEMTITQLKHELKKHPSLSFLGTAQGQGRGYFSLKSKAAKLPDHATLHDLSVESQQMLTMHLEEEPVAQEGIASEVQPETGHISTQFPLRPSLDEEKNVEEAQHNIFADTRRNSRGVTNMPTVKEASNSEAGSSPQRLPPFHPSSFHLTSPLGGLFPSSLPGPVPAFFS